jgi:hypothetical protein
LVANQSKRFHARLFVAVLREVVVVVGVIVSDNFIGRVLLCNPPRITNSRPDDNGRLCPSRGASALHSRDPCSSQADVTLAPNTAQPRHCIAANSIIGYLMAKCKLGR